MRDVKANQISQNTLIKEKHCIQWGYFLKVSTMFTYLNAGFWTWANVKKSRPVSCETFWMSLLAAWQELTLLSEQWQLQTC